MTLTELRYIIAVAQEKHFGRAADACFVTQPTLSVAVKKLEFVVLLPTTHRWQKQKTIDPNTLAEENMLLLGQGHCLRDQILSVCYNCRDTITDQHYIGSSLETLRYMVASGLGVTVLPITAAQNKNTKKDPLTYRTFNKPQPKRQIVLAWRKTFPQPKVIDVLRKAVLACKLDGIQPLS